jgi:hypothetical protein
MNKEVDEQPQDDILVAAIAEMLLYSLFLARNLTTLIDRLDSLFDDILTDMKEVRKILREIRSSTNHVKAMRIPQHLLAAIPELEALIPQN